ncbi:MAG: MerR family transcriptional regulator [Pseudoruegeria sp.]
MAKSADAFRTISEVSDWLGTPAHVLRFWESKFTQVKPVKRAGGRRYYRPNDMLLLGGLKKLLHEDGMPIKDAQKYVRQNGIKHVAGLSLGLDEKPVQTTTAQSSQEVKETIARVTDAPEAEVTPIHALVPESVMQEVAPHTTSGLDQNNNEPQATETEQESMPPVSAPTAIEPDVLGDPVELSVLESISAQGVQMDAATLRPFYQRLLIVRNRMRAAQGSDNGN